MINTRFHVHPSKSFRLAIPKVHKRHFLLASPWDAPYSLPNQHRGPMTTYQGAIHFKASHQGTFESTWMRGRLIQALPSIFRKWPSFSIQCVPWLSDMASKDTSRKCRGFQTLPWRFPNECGSRSDFQSFFASTQCTSPPTFSSFGFSHTTHLCPHHDHEITFCDPYFLPMFFWY